MPRDHPTPAPDSPARRQAAEVKMVGYITVAHGAAQRLSEKWRHFACAMLPSLFCTSPRCVGVNTRDHRTPIGVDPQLPNRQDIDWYIGPRVLCSTTDDRGNRCQHTGIVCVRHLTTMTRRDGRAYCCTAFFATRGEHHDHDGDLDPQTGDRSARCAQYVDPAVLMERYGPYQTAPPRPHAPVNRALIDALDDHAGSRDRTWIGVPPQHSGLPNHRHRDSRGPQYDVFTDDAYADAAESIDPRLRVGLRDPQAMLGDSSDDSRTSAPDLSIPSVATYARTYDTAMSRIAPHPSAARAHARMHSASPDRQRSVLPVLPRRIRVRPPALPQPELRRGARNYLAAAATTTFYSLV